MPFEARFILTLSCEDRPGIVAAVSKVLRDCDCTIIDAAQFGDPQTNHFFFRSEFKLIGCAEGGAIEAIKDRFAPVAEAFGLTWRIDDAGVKPKIMIAVSRFGHCLNDLLYRWRSGALHVEIAAVISNHETMRDLVDWHGIDYHHLPIADETKAQQEAQVRNLMLRYEIDLLVLARYMQVLSDEMCVGLRGRCINIHHSFLPSFKGARPYHAAHDRGVKLIGATAHFVTPDLDEGPIIEQDVIRVRHADTPTTCIARGRDVEAQVLARAVQWWSERRIMLNGDRTVVF